MLLLLCTFCATVDAQRIRFPQPIDEPSFRTVQAESSLPPSLPGQGGLGQPFDPYAGVTLGQPAPILAPNTSPGLPPSGGTFGAPSLTAPAPLSPGPSGSLPPINTTPPPAFNFAPPPFANTAPGTGLTPAEPAIWNWELFGEFLYLRPRNAEVAFALPVDGPIGPDAAGVPVGGTTLVDPDYELGIRVGLDFTISDSSRLGAKYTYFRSDTGESVTVEAPDLVRPLVLHPDTVNAASGILSARATYDIDFDLIDGDFRALLYFTDRAFLEYLIGGRYGRLDQDFRATFTGVGTTIVDTNIEFEGAGIRMGLEFERRAKQTGWMIYGRGVANFLAGEFDARFVQTDATGVVVATNSWHSGRIVPVLDLEFGAGWISRTGRWRFSGGYLISAWFNSVITDDYLEAVQTNRFVNLSDTLTFDGLTGRFEFRF